MRSLVKSHTASYDDGGLYVEIAPAAGKWWRLKYRFNRKENRLSLGVFPKVTLKETRELRDQARKLLRGGIDRSQDRKKRKSAKAESISSSFESVARAWFEPRSPIRVPAHGERIKSRFERDIFLAIGERPVSEISSRELLVVLCRIESRGVLETAKRALGDCHQVYQYAIGTDRASNDPTVAPRRALLPAKALAQS